VAEAARSRALFGAVWLVARTRPGNGEPLPPLGPPSHHTTVVARAPAAIAEALADTARRLEAPGGSYLYPRGTIHYTVRNLDGVDEDDVQARIAAVADLPAFDLDVRGLGLSPTTAFAQLFPADGTLSHLRRRLDGPGSRRWRPPGLGSLAFANVVRVPGRPSRELMRSVARHRHTDFGRWTVEEIELVRTDRYLSDAATVVLAGIPLVRGDAPRGV
jgi:2'-5' RNA ligase